ncbi:MAG: PEGA domain-containing protein [Kofleriaceae bacterium]
MAKTESTAVNNLIDLVSSNQRSSKPIVHPDDDLFAGPPGPAKPIKKMKTPAQPLPALPKPNGSTAVSPPRMTPTLAPMRGAGTVPPLPRTRAAGGTSRHTVPEHAPQMRMTTAPPERGTTIPPIPQRGSAPVFPPNGRMQPTFTPVLADGTPPPERVTAHPATPERAKPSTAAFAAVAPLSYPVQHRAPSPQHLERIDMTGDAVLGENWFEASRAVEKFEDETYVGTSPHVLQDRVRETSLVKKLILPAIGFMIVGALIGAFIAFNGDKKKHAVATHAVALAPVPAQPSAANAALAANIAGGTNTGATTTEPPQPARPAPVAVAAIEQAPVAPAAPATTNSAIHEIQTTRGVIQLADVRIDSKPAGATVTLIDGSKKSFLGTTPLATSLDASHTYDLEVSLAGRPEQTAHLDPAHTQHLSIDLVKAARGETTHAAPPTHVEVAAPAPKKTVATVAAKPHHAAAVKTTAAAPTDEIADPGFDSKPVAPAPEKKIEKPVVAAGTGTLMISTKPPCEILIDGKATGMSTPQRALALPAGAHKITLVNSNANINKTVMVQINADQATKLVKDLLAN